MYSKLKIRLDRWGKQGAVELQSELLKYLATLNPSIQEAEDGGCL